MAKGPLMVRADVVWDEIEHQLQAPSTQTIAQRLQLGVTTKISPRAIGLNREGRSNNILVRKIRQKLFVLLAQPGIGLRNFPGFWPGLPDSKKPNPFKTPRFNLVQCGIRNVL